jgi:hypothetical protein
MGPYRVIEEDATHVTYEYRSLWSWMLIVIALLLGVGIAHQNELMRMVGIALVALFFLGRMVLGKEASSRIRAAMASQTVQISGNKWSFKNPLRFRVPKG